jgi:2,3-dihydroxyphenylpropionate 1,2-dioxygenase
MSDLILGVGASHSTLMNTHWDEVDHLPEAHRFREGLSQAREIVAAIEPDAVVVVGSNHFRGMFLDLMPQYTIGVGEVLGAGEAGTPGGPLPVDTALARHLVDSLVDDGFDPAFSLRLTVDHGITHSVQYILPDPSIPIVPVIINAFAPPLPPLRRCHALGASIGAAIANDGESKRIVVLASGGLSHRLPWPEWFNAVSDDDRFLVEAWLNGRASWGDYEVRRREIIRAADADINEDFDRWFLDILESGDLSDLLGRTSEEIERDAGNGGNEIRAWIAMMAALGSDGAAVTARTLAYAAIPSWMTGMGVSVLTTTSYPDQAERVSAAI